MNGFIDYYPRPKGKRMKGDKRLISSNNVLKLSGIKSWPRRPVVYTFNNNRIITHLFYCIAMVEILAEDQQIFN